MPRPISWKYVNHLGETIEGDGYKVFLRDNKILDYAWSYESANGLVTRFSRNLVEKTVPIVINAETDDEGIQLRSRLYEIVEKDVLAKEPGRLYIGCWYLTGYITESAKTTFIRTNRHMVNDLCFVAQTGTWRKEKLIRLVPQTFESPRKQLDPISTGKPGSQTSPMPAGVLYHDYPFDFTLKGTLHTIYPQYDYSYDYVRTHGKQAIVNDSFVASDFIMTIYGFVSHPVISIGEQRYGVDALVYSGERIVIDSAAGTVTKVGRLGEKTNLFNSRDKSSSVFAPIPAGRSQLAWPGTYGVDLIVFEERSEPKWEDLF